MTPSTETWLISTISRRLERIAEGKEPMAEDRALTLLSILKDVAGDIPSLSNLPQHVKEWLEAAINARLDAIAEKREIAAEGRIATLTEALVALSGDAVFDALAGKFDKTGGEITGNVIAGTSDWRIASNTSPGSDENRIALQSGGALAVSRGAYLILCGADHPNTPSRAQMVAGAGSDLILTAPGGHAVRPANSGIIALGSGSFLWSEVFATNGSINTSDAREKTEPRDLTESELAAAAYIARLPCIFQWLQAIEAKGEEARLHASPTVQSVIEIMEAHGLDPFRYGFVCFDAWDEQPEVEDEETGEVTQEHSPAGDRYSLRPTELAHFLLRGLAYRQDELERRLVALEG